MAKQLGRGKPISIQQVSDWENNRKAPRSNIRAICSPVAAADLAEDILRNTLGLDEGATIPDTHVSLLKDVTGWIGEVIL